MDLPILVNIKHYEKHSYKHNLAPLDFTFNFTNGYKFTVTKNSLIKNAMNSLLKTALNSLFKLAINSSVKTSINSILQKIHSWKRL